MRRFRKVTAKESLGSGTLEDDMDIPGIVYDGTAQRRAGSRRAAGLPDCRRGVGEGAS